MQPRAPETDRERDDKRDNVADWHATTSKSDTPLQGINTDSGRNAGVVILRTEDAVEHLATNFSQTVSSHHATAPSRLRDRVYSIVAGCRLFESNRGAMLWKDATVDEIAGERTTTRIEVVRKGRIPNPRSRLGV